MRLSPSIASPTHERLARAASRRARATRRKLYLCGLVCLLALEVAARLLTRTPEGELPHFRRFTLLPYAPPEEVVRAWDRQYQTARQLTRDPLLGWTVAPNCPDETYVSNEQGIRCDPARVFTHERPTDKIRITTVGDSFTYSDDGPLEDSWQVRLEERDARLEALNFGVPAFGTDQALLRWRRDARLFRSDIVVLGIWPENVCRNLNQNRFFLTLGPEFGFKPRFVMRGPHLELLPPPAHSIDGLLTALADPATSDALRAESWITPRELEFAPWQHSRLLRLGASLYNYKLRRDRRTAIYAGQEPAATALTVAIASTFAREVGAEGSTPIVLIFPMRELVETYAERASLPLTAELEAAGLNVVDLFPAFAGALAAEGADALFQTGRASGHLTARGNELVASELLSALAPWLDPLRAVLGEPDEARDR